MDWKSIIADLSAAGVNQTELARECDCGQSTISEISRGVIKEPSFRIGKRLIELHAAKVGAGDTAKEAA